MLSEILLSWKGVQKDVSVVVRIYFIGQEEILSFRDEDVRHTSHADESQPCQRPRDVRRNKFAV
jgi:hypothetical protein